MKKNIREFREGELIRLVACGWQAVENEPQEHGEQIIVWIQILGLKYPALFYFDEDDCFEWQPTKASKEAT